MNENINYLIDWEPKLLQNKRYLMALAFRMTGSLSEAEDIVQDTFIACSTVNPEEVKNHKAWLIKVCSNKGLDHLKSAYKRREVYPGVWLPDAIPESLDPLESDLLLTESATMSFLLLVEKLSPEERVVYLLHEVFDYSFKEIAEILEKSDDACKKIAQRARVAIENERIKYDASSQNQKVITAFFEAVKRGDKNRLMELLSEDSELWSDGGGRVPVASQEVVKDASRIAQFFSALGKSKVLHSEDFKDEFHSINYRPGLVITKKSASGTWEFDTLISFETFDEKIVRIYAQRNPEKLKNITITPH